MNIKILFLLIMLVLTTHVNSQDTLSNTDFEKIREEVLKFNTAGDFHGAYLAYDKTNKNDSNYIYSLLSKSYYMLNDEELDSTKYDGVIALMDQGINYPESISKLNFYINKGVALTKMKRYEEALSNFDAALLSYPKNDNLYYRKALVYETLNQFDKAVEMYKEAITMNPFNAQAHLQLGNLCYKSDKITEALMCLNFYLLLNPDGENAINILSALNSIVSSKADIEKPIDVQISIDDDSFEELDLIINSHIALSKKYKIKNKIKVGIVKQNHLLLEQLKDYEGNNGFFDKKYIPFYNWLRDGNHFDNFVYTICYSTTADKYRGFVKSKTKEVQLFHQLITKKIEIYFGVNTLNFNGKKQVVNSYYSEKLLNGIGTKKEDKMIGYWEFFADDGYLKAIGNFNASGEKTGEWTWRYEDGKIKEVAAYENGKLAGPNRFYFKNGKLNYSASYSEGKANGEYKLYNKKGALIEQKYFVDGELEGVHKTFYALGEKYPEFTIPYTAGEINGAVFQYHVNGTKAFECNYVDDEKHGTSKSYYKNGQLIVALKYDAGILNGEYLKYYPDGKLKEKGQLENDEYIGHWTFYFNNGAIDYEADYNKDKLHGTYKNYDKDGKHFLTYEYRKGDIYAYSFFDKQGQLIHTDDKRNGSLDFVGYYANGNLKSKGLYDVKGGKEGLWKFYSKNGVLTSKSNYKDNLAEGQSVDYYNDGNEKVIQYFESNNSTGYYLKQERNKQRLEEGWHKEGVLHGEWSTYFSNMLLKSKNYYNNGKTEGEQITYNIEGGIAMVSSYKNDVLIVEKHFTNGVIYDSIVIPSNAVDTISTHYTNGKIYSQITYNYGEKNGKYTCYYENGKVKTNGNFLNTEKNGEWIWYHENGKIDTKNNYIYGDLDGASIEYYENGKTKRESTYILGEKNGVKKDYNDAGTLIASTNYEYGVQQGKKYFYSEDGHLQVIRHYNNQELIGYNYLGKDGKELPLTPIKKETVKIVAYFDNGKKSREMEVVNGDFEGAYLSYYYSGEIHREMRYKNDIQEGIEKTYYPSGELKEIEPRIAGKYNGTVINYYENGQLKKETVYLLGRKHGKSTLYSETGKVISQKNYFDGELIFN